MSTLTLFKICGTAALLACGPVALAQDSAGNSANMTTTPDMTTTTTTVPVEREDRDFPWGLLGLLGLAGLIQRKQKQPDVVVDARRDTRP